jgi:ankyrin repeat protein
LFLGPDKTPLHYSSENGFVNIVKFLCSAGADVDAIDANGVAFFLIGLLFTSLHQMITSTSSKFC